MGTARRFLRDIPSAHRTDWGESAARRLGEALDELDPSAVDASNDTLRHGGLKLVLQGATAEQLIEVEFWEDSAFVRSDEEERAYRCTAPHRRGEPDPGYNWIEDFVEDTISAVVRWSA